MSTQTHYVIGDTHITAEFKDYLSLLVSMGGSKAFFVEIHPVEPRIVVVGNVDVQIDNRKFGDST